MAKKPPSNVTKLQIVPPPPSAEEMAETDRLSVLKAVRSIDGLIDAAITKASEGLIDQQQGARTLRGGLDLELARAAATWVQVRRALIDSHPGLMSVQGIHAAPADVTPEELAAMIVEELAG